MDVSEDVRLRVKRGALWLDDHAPGWEHHLDLVGIRMEYCGRCVIGQLLAARLLTTPGRVGVYYSRDQREREHYRAVVLAAATEDGYENVHTGGSEAWDTDHGFNATGGVPEFRQLRQAWRDLVAERLRPVVDSQEFR